jgi:hypothetical protein
MMIFLLSFIMLFQPQNTDLLREARKLFFEFEENKNAPVALYKFLSAEDTSKSPVLTAYKGVARASSADAAFNPATKLSRFNEGKNLIEKALNLNPKDAEIRLLRLSVQIGAPIFLNYRSNIEEDRSLIIESLSKNPELFNDKDFSKKVLIFLHDRTKPSEKQMTILKELLQRV